MKDHCEPCILYEDNHLIVINKKAGDIVQGDDTGDRTLADVVKAHIKRRDQKPGNVFLGVVHRLDRPTSGAVVFAKTSKALARMNELFRSGGVHKLYWAVVANEPATPRATLIHYLRRNRRQNKSYASASPGPGMKRAELSYRVAARSDRYVLLEVEPATGRHHQIRTQLSAIGSPIKGDLKYGFPRSDPNGGIHLHARRISFVHPVSGCEIEVVAPVPNDTLWRVMAEQQ